VTTGSFLPAVVSLCYNHDMTCRGHIHNGAIILEQPTGLPEGTTVDVEVKPVNNAPATPLDQQSIEELTAGIDYDFDAFDRLREVSKL
jgi:hypothetical protein